MDIKNTLYLRAFGLWKVPMIFYAQPTVVKVTDDECVVKLPLTRRTKNHLGSMYFGALAVGADCAGGLMAMHAIKKSGKKISLVFKNSKADYLKRPEADVHFTCCDGKKIREMVKETIKTGRRVNRSISIVATTPKLLDDEPVATFELTLSLKAQ